MRVLKKILPEFHIYKGSAEEQDMVADGAERKLPGLPVYFTSNKRQPAPTATTAPRNSNPLRPSGPSEQGEPPIPSPTGSGTSDRLTKLPIPPRTHSRPPKPYVKLKTDGRLTLTSALIADTNSTPDDPLGTILQDMVRAFPDLATPNVSPDRSPTLTPASSAPTKISTASPRKRLTDSIQSLLLRSPAKTSGSSSKTLKIVVGSGVVTEPPPVTPAQAKSAIGQSFKEIHDRLSDKIVMTELLEGAAKVLSGPRSRNRRLTDELINDAKEIVDGTRHTFDIALRTIHVEADKIRQVTKKECPEGTELAMDNGLICLGHDDTVGLCAVFRNRLNGYLKDCSKAIETSCFLALERACRGNKESLASGEFKHPVLEVAEWLTYKRAAPIVDDYLEWRKSSKGEAILRKRGLLGKTSPATTSKVPPTQVKGAKGAGVGREPSKVTTSQAATELGKSFQQTLTRMEKAVVLNPLIEDGAKALSHAKSTHRRYTDELIAKVKTEVENAKQAFDLEFRRIHQSAENIRKIIGMMGVSSGALYLDEHLQVVVPKDDAARLNKLLSERMDSHLRRFRDALTTECYVAFEKICAGKVEKLQNDHNRKHAILQVAEWLTIGHVEGSIVEGYLGWRSSEKGNAILRARILSSERVDGPESSTSKRAQGSPQPERVSSSDSEDPFDLKGKRRVRFSLESDRVRSSDSEDPLDH